MKSHHSQESLSADPKDLAAVREGVSSWNQYRRSKGSRESWSRDIFDNGGELSGNINLAKVDLSANITEEVLFADRESKGDQPDSYDFSRSLLEGSSFENCKLDLANFSNSQCNNANFSNASLCESDFTGSECVNTNFSNADLHRSSFRGAHFYGTNFSGSHLVAANLTNARTFNCDFSEADLRYAKGLVFDECNIKGAILGAFPKDPWSVLCATYSGPSYTLNLLLIIIFLSPYVLQTLFWKGISYMQDYNTVLFTSFTSGKVVENYASCLSEWCAEVPVWKLLIGANTSDPLWLVSIVLLTYNFTRLVMTIYITKMRGHFDRDGITPGYDSEHGGLTDKSFYEHLRDSVEGSYLWLHQIHRVLSIVFYLAFILSAYRLFRVLLTEISVPM